MAIQNWSQTAASNTSLESINCAEGQMTPSSVNNLFRAMAAALREIQANSSIASASTVNIGAATAEYLAVSGTTTITAFDTVAAGVYRVLRFSGVLTLTHNGTSLILPTGASITTAANDRAGFRSLGSGNWFCEWYTRASGAALVNSGGTVTSVAAGSGLSGGTITGAGTLALDIASLTEDTAPAATADYLATYDASALGSKRVRLDALPGTIKYGTGYTRDPISGVNWDSGNIAHGLAAYPRGYEAYLECKSAELGYSVGDRVSWTVNSYIAGDTASLAVISDATNIRVRWGNNALPSLPNKTTTGGGTTGITGANWLLVVTPFKVVG